MSWALHRGVVSVQANPVMDLFIFNLNGILLRKYGRWLFISKAVGTFCLTLKKTYFVSQEYYLLKVL